MLNVLSGLRQEPGQGGLIYPVAAWIRTAANFTLNNVATEQRIFDATTNGRLNIDKGQYWLSCLLLVDTMSPTSGNLAFDPLGAGTATCDQFAMDTMGVDAGAYTNAATLSGSATITQQTPASAVTAGTGTAARMRFEGMFRVTAAGTLIPSLTLVTAAAARVLAGSHFILLRLGDDNVNFGGNWD